MAPAPAPAPSATLIITIGSQAIPGLQSVLAGQGFPAWTSASRHDLPTLLALRTWSLVLLDLATPGGHSLASCSRVRDLYPGPIAAVSPRSTDSEQLQVLEAGVDEFLPWPLAPDLLGARLRALVRRQERLAAGAVPARPPAGEVPIQVGDLRIDPGRRAVDRAGRPVPLTDLEFDLLHLLARNAGRPVSRETLSLELRGVPHDVRDRSLDLRISRLRRKLGDDRRLPRLLLTVRGVGYQLAAAPL